MAKFEEYAKRYKFIDLTRDQGVLVMQLHSKHAPMEWSTRTHDELGEAFTDIARDTDTRVVILTGTGDSFISKRFRPTEPNLLKEALSMDAFKWDHIFASGIRLLRNMLDINVPVIAAVNGPALVHAELAVMCDIVIASETAEFQDSHFQWDVVPGDGCHVIWPMLLGPNRGRHFLVTGQKIPVDEALRLGLVSEILPPERLMTRAHEIALNIASRSELVIRYTRALFAQPFKRALTDDLPLGLSLEGLARSEKWGTRTPG